MGFGSIWHWLVVLLIVMLLFGAGKLPGVMKDLGKGIRGFKDGLKGEADAEANKAALDKSDNDKPQS